MIDDSRGPCPICDRLACARSGLINAYMAKMDRWREGVSERPTVGEGDAMQEAIMECDRHRVDWRTRCLKAETAHDQIERLRAVYEAARSYVYNEFLTSNGVADLRANLMSAVFQFEKEAK